jgi:hypothetical protein
MGLLEKGFSRIAPYQFYEYKRRKQSFKWPRGKKFILSLTFDCDYKQDYEAMPELLDELSSYKTKCSFACIGIWVERFPKIHRKVLENGHEIINHTYSHPNNDELSPRKYFNKISRREQIEEIEKMQNICKEVLDYSPVGFRTPHFGNLHGNYVYPLLEKVGFLYSSSAISSSVNSPYKVDGVLELPLTTCPRHYGAAFDSYHGLRLGQHRNDFSEVFWKMCEVESRKGGYVNVYFDPMDVSGSTQFSIILEMASKDKEVWVAKCNEVAELMWDGLER